MKLTRRAACRLMLRSVVGASVSLLLARDAEAAGRRKPEFRFTESYARKVVKVRDEDGSQVFEPVESGKFNLYARLPFDELDPSTFDEDTAITVELEEAVFDLLLGDDPNYVAGRTSALITFSDVDENENEIAYLSFQLRWTTKDLTIRANGVTPDFEDPIIAGEYLDDITRRFQDVSDAAITVDDTTYYFDVDYVGRVNSRTIVRGPAREEFEVSAVRLQAKGLSAGIDQLGSRSKRRASGA